jgi:hypothetical protein
VAAAPPPQPPSCATVATIVRLLLTAGSDPGATTRRGSGRGADDDCDSDAPSITPVALAVASRQYEAAAVLLATGRVPLDAVALRVAGVTPAAVVVADGDDVRTTARSSRSGHASDGTPASEDTAAVALCAVVVRSLQRAARERRQQLRSQQRRQRLLGTLAGSNEGSDSDDMGGLVVADSATAAVAMPPDCPLRGAAARVPSGMMPPPQARLPVSAAAAATAAAATVSSYQEGVTRARRHLERVHAAARRCVPSGCGPSVSSSASASSALPLLLPMLDTAAFGALLPPPTERSVLEEVGSCGAVVHRAAAEAAADVELLPVVSSASSAPSEVGVYGWTGDALLSSLCTATFADDHAAGIRGAGSGGPPEESALAAQPSASPLPVHSLLLGLRSAYWRAALATPPGEKNGGHDGAVAGTSASFPHRRRRRRRAAVTCSVPSRASLHVALAWLYTGELPPLRVLVGGVGGAAIVPDDSGGSWGSRVAAAHVAELWWAASHGHHMPSSSAARLLSLVLPLPPALLLLLDTWCLGRAWLLPPMCAAVERRLLEEVDAMVPSASSAAQLAAPDGAAAVEQRRAALEAACGVVELLAAVARTWHVEAGCGLPLAACAVCCHACDINRGEDAADVAGAASGGIRSSLLPSLEPAAPPTQRYGWQRIPADEAVSLGGPYSAESARGPADSCAVDGSGGPVPLVVRLEERLRRIHRSLLSIASLADSACTHQRTQRSFPSWVVEQHGSSYAVRVEHEGCADDAPAASAPASSTAAAWAGTAPLPVALASAEEALHALAEPGGGGNLTAAAASSMAALPLDIAGLRQLLRRTTPSWTSARLPSSSAPRAGGAVGPTSAVLTAATDPGLCRVSYGLLACLWPEDVPPLLLPRSAVAGDALYGRGGGGGCGMVAWERLVPPLFVSSGRSDEEGGEDVGGSAALRSLRVNGRLLALLPPPPSSRSVDTADDTSSVGAPYGRADCTVTLALQDGHVLATHRAHAPVLLARCGAAGAAAHADAAAIDVGDLLVTLPLCPDECCRRGSADGGWQHSSLWAEALRRVLRLVYGDPTAVTAPLSAVATPAAAAVSQDVHGAGDPRLSPAPATPAAAQAAGAPEAAAPLPCARCLFSALPPALALRLAMALVSAALDCGPTAQLCAAWVERYVEEELMTELQRPRPLPVPLTGRRAGADEVPDNAAAGGGAAACASLAAAACLLSACASLGRRLGAGGYRVRHGAGLAH